MSFNESFAELKYDKRMLDWNLRQGVITKEEYGKHLNKLPDLKDECTEISDINESTAETSNNNHLVDASDLTMD